MGIETAIICATLAVTIAMSAWAATKAGKSKSTKNEYSDFSVTQAEEGLVIPFLYGKVKTQGNIDYYTTWLDKVKHNHQHVRTYVLCMRQILSATRVTPLDIYENDEKFGFTAYNRYYRYGSYWFYKGYGEPYRWRTTGSRWGRIGQNAWPNSQFKLQGVAWIYFHAIILDVGMTSAPNYTIELQASLDGIGLSNIGSFSWGADGENPARIAYHLIKEAGGRIDIASFTDATNYCNEYHLALNIAITDQQELSELLQSITDKTQIYFFNKNGAYFAKPFRFNDGLDETQRYEIDENDFLEFTFARPSYNDIPSDFVFSYGAYGYTERTKRFIIEGVKDMTGNAISKNYDWSGYSYFPTKLASEIIKAELYPKAQIKAKLPLRYNELFIGDVIDVSYKKIKLPRTFFRITSIKKDFLGGTIEFEASETLINKGEFKIDGSEGGETEDVTPDMSVYNVSDSALFDVIGEKSTDYNNLYCYPMAVYDSHKKMDEYEIYIAKTTNSSYNYIDNNILYCFKGILVEDYPADTYSLDLENGILIDFNIEDFPLDNFSLAEMFDSNRFIKIDNEIMKFSTVVEDNNGHIRLGGVIRGIKALHRANTAVYICNIDIDDLPLTLTNDYIGNNRRIKYVTKNRYNAIELDSATSFGVDFIRTVKQPIIRAIRESNGDIILEFFVNSNTYGIGAGYNDANHIIDSMHNFEMQGNLIIDINGVTQNTTQTKHIIHITGNVSIAVSHYINGWVSDTKELLIPQTVGEYWG